MESLGGTPNMVRAALQGIFCMKAREPLEQLTRSSDTKLDTNALQFRRLGKRSFAYQRWCTRAQLARSPRSHESTEPATAKLATPTATTVTHTRNLACALLVPDMNGSFNSTFFLRLHRHHTHRTGCTIDACQTSLTCPASTTSRRVVATDSSMRRSWVTSSSVPS